MPEISLPSWLNAKPASEGLLDAISTGNQEERMRVSNFAELQRLKMQKQESDQRQEQAKALMPLVLKEQQFKTDMAALKMKMTEQQWNDEVNAGKGMADLSTMQNFLTDFNKWGTDEGEVALSSLEVKYPGIGKHPMYKEAKDWNANAARSRERIQQLNAAGAIRADIAGINADTRINVADINAQSKLDAVKERFNSPFGHQFSSQVKMQQYDELSTALVNSKTPEELAKNSQRFEMWKRVAGVNLKEDPSSIVQKFQLTEEAKSIQHALTGEIAAIQKDPSTSTAQKQMSIKRAQEATSEKLAKGRKAFLDAKVSDAMPKATNAAFQKGTRVQQNGIEFEFDGTNFVPVQ